MVLAGRGADVGGQHPEPTVLLEPSRYFLVLQQNKIFAVAPGQLKHSFGHKQALVAEAGDFYIEAGELGIGSQKLVRRIGRQAVAAAARRHRPPNIVQKSHGRVRVGVQKIEDTARRVLGPVVELCRAAFGGAGQHVGPGLPGQGGGGIGALAVGDDDFDGGLGRGSAWCRY